jgi:putative glutathione S-transferase
MTAERDRYFLYVSLGCPLSCAVLAAINLKNLQEFFTVVVAHPVLRRTKPDDPYDQHNGWGFVDPRTTPFVAGPTGRGQYSTRGCSPDPLYNAKSVRELYERGSSFRGCFTLPLLWDAKTQSIVSNDSSDLVRMFNCAFRDLVPCKINLFPAHLEGEIDDIVRWVDEHIVNVVFKCGCRPTQEAYESGATRLFDALDALDEKILSRRRYLACSDQITAVDLRLFGVLIRFDEVYAVLFKLNRKLVRQYSNLFNVSGLPWYLPLNAKGAEDFDHVACCAVCEGAVPDPRDPRDGRYGAHQDVLLRFAGQPEPVRCHPRRSQHRLHGAARPRPRLLLTQSRPACSFLKSI